MKWRVAGARQAGVAEVARRVVRLLERAQHEHADGAAVGRLAGHDPRHLGGRVGGLLRRHVLRQRRRGDVEAGQLVGQELDRARLGPLVHPVEGRAACGPRGSRPPARWPAPSAPRSGGATRSAPPGARRSRGPRESNSNTGSGAPMARASRGARGARGPPRARPRAARPRAPRRARGPANTRVHLPVGEPGVAADARAVERHLADLGALHLELDRHGQLLLARAAASRRGSRAPPGSIGSTAPGHVHARGAARWPPCRAARRDAGRRSRRRCGPRGARARSRGVAEIASSKSLASSGSIVNVGRSVRSTRASAAYGSSVAASASAVGRAAVAAVEAAIEHQALHHVAGAVGAPEHAHAPWRRACRSPPARGRRARACRAPRPCAARGRRAARATRKRPRFSSTATIGASRRPRGAPRAGGAHRARRRTVSSATGSASSRSVSRVVLGLHLRLDAPCVVIVLPLGR